jgi:hypothetical protein
MAPPNDLIGYDALQQEALRGVVRLALKQTAEHGLPGKHHFYITFKTFAAGVSGPREVMAQYPDEMTIVLEGDRYRNLAPGETYFTVTLAFGGQPKDLAIPYAAITHFRDPSVEYQLRFPAPEPPPIAAIAPSPAADAAGVKALDGPPNIVSLDHFRKK